MREKERECERERRERKKERNRVCEREKERGRKNNKETDHDRISKERKIIELKAGAQSVFHLHRAVKKAAAAGTRLEALLKRLHSSACHVIA